MGGEADFNRAEQCVFLRSNSAGGCVSFLHALPGDAGGRVVLLRSGYGGAAEALLRQLTRRAAALARRPQLLFDGSGREHPCALLIQGDGGREGVCFLEAEAPFAIEARLPGGGEEVFSLDACRENALLRERRAELRLAAEAWQRELQHAARFLRAAAAMKRNMAYVTAETLDLAKIKQFASRLAARKFPPPGGHVGRESRRFLTGLTGQGLLLRSSSLASQFSDSVVLEDDTGAVAPLLWDLLRAYALGNGLDVISCPCLLAPEAAPEHLLFPALGLALLTANRRHPIAPEGTQRVLAGRFYAREALQTHRCRLRFCRRALRELLAESYKAQAAAEEAKATLDAIYTPTLRPGAIESCAEQLLPA
ncbi:MAG: hypothetical protein LBS96_08770 [Oscillospiraceae bacterium]|jgi:hypothetical protein|nr:hypothetical protein [Oscillospiraceae bacterium]